LGLHAGPDQGQRVAGQLPARTGGGAARQQHKHAGVRAVRGVALQPPVLQGLDGVQTDGNGKELRFCGS